MTEGMGGTIIFRNIIPGRRENDRKKSVSVHLSIVLGLTSLTNKKYEYIYVYRIKLLVLIQYIDISSGIHTT